MARGNISKKERVRRAMILLGPDAPLSEIAFLANMQPIGAVRVMKQLRATQTGEQLGATAKTYPVRGTSRWTLPEAQEATT